MEVRPVKKAKPPKYPRMDEVSPESIKEALPRRWMANRAAKAALAALAGCMPGQVTILLKGYVDPGVPEPPIIPYCIAAGLALGIGIWIRHKVKKRKGSGEGEGKAQPAESQDEKEYDEGEY